MPTQSYPENQAEMRIAAAGGECSAATTVAAPRPMRGWIRAALALVFVLYVRAVGFAPVYDDNVISEWTSGWRDIPQFFTHDIFGSDGQAHSVYYRPVALTWGLLVGWVSGGVPGWLHLTAILLHLAAVLLAYLLGRKLLHDDRVALLAALLFGVHPSKVETVAWIGSSTVDGLGGVLFFAALIAFLNWRERVASGEKARRWWAASVALFAIAIFTKETMICIPALLAAYLWMNPCEGEQPPGPAARLWRIGKALLPYAAITAIYMAIRHQVIRPTGPSIEYLHPTYTHSNLWTAPFAIWWYLRHLVMPWGLAVEYTETVLHRPTLTGFVLPALALAWLALGGWWLWRHRRSMTAAFLALWFVLTLAPPVIVAPMVQEHDRYLYLACYPFCALLAWAILRVGSVSSRARFALGLGAVGLWSALTWHEMGYWDSDATLWARVLEIAPSNGKAEVQMAFLYADAGDVERAIAVLKDGLRYHPDSPGLWLARANILAGSKRAAEAREAYLNVMRVTEPPAGEVLQAGPRANTRAVAAYQLARLALEASQFVEGERYARTALDIKPQGAGFHAVLAAHLRGQGRAAEANTENATELRLRLEEQRRMQHR